MSDTYIFRRQRGADITKPGTILDPSEQAQARANIGVVTVGGVAVAAGSTATAYTLPGFTGTEWTLCSWIRRDGPISIFVDGAIFGEGLVTNHKSLFFETDGSLNVGSTFVHEVGRWHHIAYTRSGDTVSLYVDGVLRGSETAANFTNTIPTQYLSAGNCSRADMHFFNRALTAGERAAVMRGEVPAALAKRGYVPTRSVFASSNSTSVISGATQSGFTVDSYTSSDSGDSTYVIADNTEHHVVFSFDASGFTVLPVYAELFTVSPYASVGVVAAANGTNTISATIPAGFAGRTMILRIAYANAGVAVSNVSYRVLGTVARYEPGDVTSLGRWLDSSGNGYDLIPGAGITPLKPQPVQVRMDECLYDLGSSVAADAPAGWTLAKTGTGILTMTPPAYVKAIKPPVVTANSANGGYTVDTAVNQSTGVVTVTSRNAGTPADSVLYIVAAHRE